MRLTPDEQAMLSGEHGPVVAEAIDYVIQFGEAFGADRLVDITYCHYPAEMAIYEGSVEDVAAYSERGGRVAVPTTTSTLCCDLERPASTGCPAALASLQARAETAHRRMGLLETYTCTPQSLGFIPPFGSYNLLVESSAIIYYNSVLGARTNRGGLLTRYSAVCGKYPLMGYLLDRNRRGTLLFNCDIPADRLRTYDGWSALGFHIGAIAGSAVPVIDGVRTDRQDFLIGLGAALATSGSVSLFHLVGVTPEARTVDEALQRRQPERVYEVTAADLDEVYRRMTTIQPGEPVDFVTLGCPHYNLEQLRVLAGRLAGRHIATGVRLWVTTNRMTKQQAEYSGYVKTIEDSGALVVADCCPVESHLRASTCREHGLPVPNVKALVTDSVKMARYSGDLIGCQTALADFERCLTAAFSGRWQ
ncbi:aconitase X catalytic domain-containing protein [bacterium]|nr:aconitase X catalytic domain-containing protein [bacterium]